MCFICMSVIFISVDSKILHEKDAPLLELCINCFYTLCTRFLIMELSSHERFLITAIGAPLHCYIMGCYCECERGSCFLFVVHDNSVASTLFLWGEGGVTQGVERATPDQDCGFDPRAAPYWLGRC